MLAAANEAKDMMKSAENKKTADALIAKMTAYGRNCDEYVDVDTRNLRPERFVPKRPERS